MVLYFPRQDAICSSLHEYNQHIEELKSEMQVNYCMF